MLHICLVDNIQIILSVGKLYCDRYVIGPNSYMLQICDRYLSYNCDRYLSYNCDRYLSYNCDRYVMGPNSYMLQICDRYFRTYILQIFYRTVTYICHISVSLVRVGPNIAIQVPNTLGSLSFSAQLRRMK
jgi:hypothetical protein